VRCQVYKGAFTVVGRFSATGNLYDMSESSMDEIGDFEPTDTTGFINVQAIRLKKYGKMKEEMGESLVKKV
jgi:argininosuccinate synthase